MGNIFDNWNWRTFLNNRLSYYKQGGQLVSRNPVQRFKQKHLNNI